MDHSRLQHWTRIHHFYSRADAIIIQLLMAAVSAHSEPGMRWLVAPEPLTYPAFLLKLLRQFRDRRAT
jgi:hypothetical protein